jgi:beta-glucanase (GH16 family)
MTHRQTRLSLILLTTLSSSAAAQSPAGWALNWADEFNTSSLDTARWENLSRRDSFNNEKQYYTPSQVSVANGVLRITANNQPLDGKAYRSGLARTWAEQTYGRWEVRASLPATQGMWPAIWLLPRNANWPSGGEIDIMENRGSQPTVVGSAYHWGANVSSHQWVARDFGYSVNGTPVSFQNSMHNYAVEWDPSRIRYLIDGVPHYTFHRNTAPISSTPMSLILNLAIGGDYGGDPNGSTVFPQRFDIDSVKVFNRDNSTRGINNNSFESKAGNLFTEWDEYSNGANVTPDTQAANARTGSTAAQVYGRYSGAGTNYSGLFQEVPASPGEVWQVNGWSRNRPGDLIAGANSAQIKVEFINQDGLVIGLSEVNVASAGSPTMYREAVARRVAPAGTVFARAVLQFTQVNNAGGAVNFDDVYLRRVTGSSLAGDINLDGSADAADLDALLHSLAGGNIALDFNTDNAINGLDVDAVLASAFGTTRGDTNLDGAVDFNDLLVLAQHYGAIDTARWALGDFNGDSDVAFDDLLLMAQNYGAGALTDELAPAFATDWALAQSLVPEPTMLGMLLGVLIPFMRRTNGPSRRRADHILAVHVLNAGRPRPSK